jgi:hypothetical protein
MKRLILGAALACALSATVIAGEIPTTGAPAPPPTGIAGEIPSTGAPAPLANSDSLVVNAILTIISIVV